MIALRIMNIKRTQIRFIQIVLDSIASIVISLSLLFFFSTITFRLAFVYAVVFLLIKISGNYFFGGYQQLWRYTSLREVQNLGFNSLLFIPILSRVSDVILEGEGKLICSNNLL